MHTIPGSTIVILFITLVAICFVFFHVRGKRAARRAQIEELANCIIGSSRYPVEQDLDRIFGAFKALNIQKKDFEILGKSRYHEVLEAFSSLEWSWRISKVSPCSKNITASLSEAS